MERTNICLLSKDPSVIEKINIFSIDNPTIRNLYNFDRFDFVVEHLFKNSSDVLLLDWKEYSKNILASASIKYIHDRIIVLTNQITWDSFKIILFNDIRCIIIDSAPSEIFSQTFKIFLSKKYFCFLGRERDGQGLNIEFLKKICIPSKREFEIINFMLEGYENQELAKKIFVSVGTVEQHIVHIRQKLRLNTTRQLIVFISQNYAEVKFCCKIRNVS